MQYTKSVDSSSLSCPSSTATRRAERPSTRRPALRWALGSAFLAFLAFVRPALAADTLTEARDIAAECAAAEAALTSTNNCVGGAQADYRRAYVSAQQRVTQAYRLSLLAQWPESLADARSTIETGLAQAVSDLAVAVNFAPPAARTQRATDFYWFFQLQITRVHQAGVACTALAPAESAATGSGAAAGSGSGSGSGSGAASGAAIATLPAGTGFNGATSQPSAVGSGTGLGATAQPMARWDVVPHQTISGTFPLGVVAFHVNGIDRVEFSLDGGSWRSASAMTENSVTHVVEYCAAVDASTLADGEHEVRAIAYPRAGVPRVLEPLVVEVAADRSTDAAVWVDPTNGNDGTVAANDRTHPARSLIGAVRMLSAQNQSTRGTLDVSGGTIYLMAGHHTWGPFSGGNPHWVTAQNKRWLKITRDSQTLRRDVIIDGRGALQIYRTQVSDVTVKGAWGGLFVTSSSFGGELWLSDCDITSDDKFGSQYLFVNGWQKLYRTNCNITNMPYGEPVLLSRGDNFEDIVGDVFSGCLMVVNARAANVSRIGTSSHTDLYQFMNGGANGIENVIVYGLTATTGIAAQGLFCGGGERLKDIAFVNVVMDNSWGNARGISDLVFQFFSPTSHMYLKDCTITGACLWRTAYGFTAEDIVIENTRLPSYGNNPMEPGQVTGVTYR